MTPGYRLLVGVFLLFPYAVAPAQIGALPATFEVRTVNGIAVPFQNGMPVPSFEKQHRATFDLGGVWKKQRFAANHDITLGARDATGYSVLIAEAAGRQLRSYDDAAWPDKNLPAVENQMNGVDVRPEDYEDGVFYRKSFSLSDTLQGRFARLNFYAVNYVADVWLNGTYLGYHEGGYTSFSFDATPALRFDSVNVLVVRVDNPPWGSRDDVVPYGTVDHKPDWFNYTGILHDVYLEFSDPVSIARTDVIPQSTDGTIEATSTIWNRSASPMTGTLTFEVYEAQIDSHSIRLESPADLPGSLVATQSIAVSVAVDSAFAGRTTLVVPNPKLWSPKHPSLYVLRAVLKNGTTTQDVQCVQFGIRTLAITGNSLLLNHQPMFFPGIARHEDHYLYGRAVPDSIIYDDLLKIVDLNATFLRTAHYPNHPYTYLLADRLGLAIMEEIPVWWFDEANAWANQDLHRHIHEQMWREMLFRDRNRPSILLWSTCNECRDTTNRGAFIQRLNTELDTQYPDGRFVTESAAADRPGPWDPTQAFSDVAGWTMYFGVFYGTSYYGGTASFIIKALSTYAAKPFIDTEFGYWSTETVTPTTANDQIRVFTNTFSAFSQFVTVDSNGTYRPGSPLAAVTWWCAFDWCTTQQATGAQTMGVYKMDHTTIKPVAATIRDAYRPYKASSETAVIGAVNSVSNVPTEYRLEQNYPNPFNPTTRIKYTIGGVRAQGSGFSEVRVVIYDLLGRVVKVLVDEMQTPGTYTVAFDGSRLASGVYFCRLIAGRYSATNKMVLTR